MYLFIDAETTGKYHFDKPSDHPDQPHIVEIAMLLCDEHGTEWGSFNSLIHCHDPIPQEVTDIHGITAHHCANYGLWYQSVIDITAQMVEKASLIIGHNVSFDIKMIKSQMRGEAFVKRLNEIPAYCTMMNSTAICKLPKAKGGGYKWPKLAEAYKVICGKELIGGHRAMADVRACKEIFFRMRSGDA